MLRAIGLLVVIVMAAAIAGALWRHGSALRWRRFFFRAWVVVSAVWVIAIFVAAWEKIVEPIPAPPAECGRPGEMACVTKDDALVGSVAPRELRPAPLSVELERAGDVAPIALIPPAGLLILGLACAWVLRGLWGGTRA
jgi:hypothetical protein